MATDPTTIPSVVDLQKTKKSMTDIDTFVDSGNDSFTDNNGQTRRTLTGINSEITQKLLEINKSRGFRVVGTFAAGFDYELFNDVGIDASGNSWVYVGSGAPVKTVTAGTVPSAPDYQQVTFNSIDSVSGLRDELNDRALYLTLAEAQAKTDLAVGQYVKLVDKKLYTFVVVNNQDNIDNARKYAVSNGMSIELVEQTAVLDVAAFKSGSDNTVSIQAAFDYANEVGAVVTSTEDFSLSATVDTHGIEFDLSNITVTVLDTFSQSYLFSCIDPLKQVLNNYNLGTYQDYQTSTPSLQVFGICTVMISSTEQAYRRAPSTDIFKHDILTLVNGYHPTTPSFFDITTPVTITVLPRRNQLQLRLPNIAFESPVTELRAVLYIERNDVEIDTTYTELTDGETLRGVVESQGTTNIKVNDMVASFQDDSFGYLFNGFCCDNVQINNCHVPVGWRVVDGNFMKNTECFDSTGSSFGVHATAHNFTVERCKTYASTTRGGGVNVMGRGLLKVKDLEHVITAHDANSTENTQYAVSTRADYGQAWDGDIEVESVNVLVTGVVTNTYRVLDVAAARLAGALDYTKDAIAGKNISLKNITVDNKSGSPISLQLALLNTSYQQPINLPESYSVDGVTLIGDFSFVGYTMFGAQTNPNIRQTLTRMDVRNVSNPTTATEFTVIVNDTDRPLIRNRIEYSFDNHQGLRAKFKLPQNYKVKVNNSTIKEFDCDPIDSEDFGRYEIKESIVEADGLGCGARGGSTNTEMRLYNNEFTFTGSIKMGHGIKVCSGNIAPSTATLTGGGPNSGASLWELRTGYL